MQVITDPANNRVSVDNAAKTVTYTPSANFNGTDSFDFQVKDDGGLDNGGLDTSNIATVDITVVAVNDSIVTTDVSLPDVAEDSSPFGELISTLVGPVITDADSNASLQGIAITANTETSVNGEWQYAVAGGTWQNISDQVTILSDNNALLLDAGTALRFLPAGNYNGVPDPLVYRAIDNSYTGVLSSSAQRVTTDSIPVTNDSSFSNSANISIVVNPVNDAPVIADAALQPEVEDTTSARIKIIDLFAAQYSDADGTPEISGVSVTFNPAISTEGTWQYSTDSANWLNINSTRDSAALLLDRDTYIRFSPAANFYGNPADLLLRAVDGTYTGSFTSDNANRLFLDTTVAGTMVSEEYSVSIEILPVNDAPEGADKLVTVLEDSPYIFNTVDFGFSDTVESDDFATVTIISLPENGTIHLSSTPVNTGDSISTTDIANGNLRYTPDANDTTQHAWRFVVSDNGGTDNNGNDTDLSPNTMTIDILSVNDAPEAQDATLYTDESTPITLAESNFGFTDTIDADGFKSIIVESLPANGTLQLGQSAIAINQVIDRSDIAGGQLVFLPAPVSATVTEEFAFRVMDDGGTSNGGDDTSVRSSTISIEVSVDNSPPLGTDNVLELDEDSIITLDSNTFGFTDNIDNHSLATVVITALPTNGTLHHNGLPVTGTIEITADDLDSGQLTFSPEANANGFAYSTLQFKVTDNGKDNSGKHISVKDNTLTFNVTPVNDAPQGTTSEITLAEDTSFTFNIADFGFSDPLDNHNLQSVLIEIPPAAGTLKLNNADVSSGDMINALDISELVYTPAASEYGQQYDQLIFRVIDDGAIQNGGSNTSISTDTIVINVSPVNDAPTGSDKSFIIDESGIIQFTSSDFGFADEFDQDNFKSIIIQSLPSSGELLLGQILVTANDVIEASVINQGLLTFVPAPLEEANADAFLFKVVDTGGTVNNGDDTSAQANTISIEIVTDNHPPLAQDTNIELSEDTTLALVAGDFQFIDAADNHSMAGVFITTVPADGNLLYNGAAVTPDTFITTSELNAGLLQFQPAANEFGTAYAELQFRVVDDGKTDSGKHVSVEEYTMTFDVVSVNDAPENLTFDGAMQISENTENVEPGLVSFTDVDPDDEHQYNVSDERFTVVDGVLTLKPGVTLDHEEEPTVALQISVTDSAGGAATHNLTLQVLDVNEAPGLVNTQDNQSGIAPFSFALPENMFIDIDDDALEISATLADGSPLPDWVQFDGSTFTINAVDDTDDLNVLVTATDPDGLSADSFISIFIEPGIAAAQSLPAIPEQAPSFSITRDDTEELAVTGTEEATATEQEENQPAAVGESFNSDEITPPDNTLVERQLIDVVQLQEDRAGTTGRLIERTELDVKHHRENELTLQTTDYEQEQSRREVVETTQTLKNLAAEADRQQDAITDAQVLSTKVLATSVTLSSGLSVGYIIWLLRGGTLLASMVASLPAWRTIDPLPVLESLSGDDDGEDETLESMVEDSTPDDNPDFDENKAA